MKDLIPLLMLAVVFAAGCLPAALTPPNELPAAYIDSVSPSQVSPGETVTLEGHGTAPAGSVVAYKWRSNIDGDLSTSASFETSSLSEGTHTIHFRVQDSNGDWSKGVSWHITVLPREIAKPIANSFDASPGSVAKGESATLRWDVSGAATVSIDPGVGNVTLTGTRVVFPNTTTTYILTAANEAGSVTAMAEIKVATVPMHTVEVFSIAAEDGHVTWEGQVGPEPNVGDTNPVRSDVAMQAFLSFDISMIPSGVTVVSAFLDLTSYTTFGNPFVYLGTMRVCSDQYGVLDSDDFVIGPITGTLYAYSRRPTEPLTSDLLNDAVQAQVEAGSERFQIRLQFEKDTCFNLKPDYLALAEGEAKLVIEYED